MPSVPYEAEELLRRLAATLTARGFRVRRASSASSRRLTITRENGECEHRADSEVIVDDDGYVEWRYWPGERQPADPARIANVITDVLSAELGTSEPPPGAHPGVGSLSI
jgi:hypothetical protein